jgi:hypothetical protein
MLTTGNPMSRINRVGESIQAGVATGEAAMLLASAVTTLPSLVLWQTAAPQQITFTTTNRTCCWGALQPYNATTLTLSTQFAILNSEYAKSQHQFKQNMVSVPSC